MEIKSEVDKKVSSLIQHQYRMQHSFQHNQYSGMYQLTFEITEILLEICKYFKLLCNKKCKQVENRFMLITFSKQQHFSHGCFRAKCYFNRCGVSYTVSSIIDRHKLPSKFQKHSKMILSTNKLIKPFTTVFRITQAS